MQFIVLSDTQNLRFEEVFTSVEPYAIISGVFLQLDQPSLGREHRIYRFSEARQMIDSLIHRPVYYGSDVFGIHKTSKKDLVGRVEACILRGSKLIGFVKITSRTLIDKLRRGLRLLFSVGGSADYEESVKDENGQTVNILHNAKMEHLTIVPRDTKVGFPKAKMLELIELNETVMLVDPKEIAEIGTLQLLSAPELQREIFKELTNL